MKKLVVGCVLVLVLVSSGVATADTTGWETFVIRNGSSGSPAITEDPTGYTGWTLFGIVEGGQKAGWGTNSMNGQTIGDIESLSITRHDDVPIYNYGPYFNIWITDGSGGYAVLANEPSHTSEYSAYGETAHNMTWDGALKDATAWVYEVDATQGFWLPDGNKTTSSLGAGTADPFTFEDFADYQIVTPTTLWGGGGAPDDLYAASYTAYGFNWIFGDTQSNYVAGYLVKEPTLVSSQSIPEPVSFAVWALIGCMGLVGCRRRAK